MLYCLMCFDKKDSVDIRAQNRGDHLDYVTQTQVVTFAGPLLTEEDAMMGSLVVIEVDSKEAARQWCENDPYNKAGLFEKVDIFKFKRVI